MTSRFSFTYSISAANTWEYKTVTVAGPTAGTWLTTNGVGLRVNFGLGCGSNNNGTAGAWAAANYTSATGATSVVGTNGATFYLTGVQLEVGSVATPFERRLYPQELALGQRYFQTHLDLLVSGYNGSGGVIYTDFILPVFMRTGPTAAFATSPTYANGNSLSVNSAFSNRVRFQLAVTSTGYGVAYGQNLTLTAEL